MQQPSEIMSGVFNFMKLIDGQTIFSICVGLFATFLTFYWAYRKTIGAKEERTRSTDKELVTLVLHRVAIDRELMSQREFDATRRIHAARSQVPYQRQVKFSDALDSALTDVINNLFIDKKSKKIILEIIDKSRQLTDDEPDETLIDDGHKPEKKIIISVVSVASGILASLISSTITGDTFSEAIKRAGPDILPFVFALTIMATILFIILLYRIILSEKKEKHKTRGDDFGGDN